MDKLAAQIELLADRYGPYTIEMARSAATISAWKDALTALSLFLVFSALAWAGQRYARKMWYMDEKEANTYPIPTEVIFVISVACMVLGGVGILCSAFDLLNPWTWAGLVNPDLYIARKTLGL